MRVAIREVGPRDGFQNEPEIVPTRGQGLANVLAAARAVQDVPGRPLGSHVLPAGPVEWHERSPS